MDAYKDTRVTYWQSAIWVVWLRACAPPFHESSPLIVLNTMNYFLFFLKSFLLFCKLFYKKKHKSRYVCGPSRPGAKTLDIDQATWSRTNSVIFHPPCFLKKMIKLAMCVPHLQKRSINTKMLAIDQTAGSRTSVVFHQAWKNSEKMHLFFFQA